MRDLFTADVEKLIIDSRPEYDRVKKFIAAFMPDFAGHIELYDGNDPIFDGYGIEIEIDRALERKVWLKSGGYLIVDEMEALTAIDVNTGRFVGKKSLEDTITKTNLEAAQEVAEQLRIRSIGGMIVVDFIDMDRPHNREKVTRAFNEHLRRDRSKAAVTRISELGLIEMTRKRTRESLLHTLTEPCTACEGKGYTKSRRTVTYELLRELRRQGDLVEGDTVLVEVHPDVAQVLASTDRPFLEEMEKRLQKRIVVKARGSFHVEDFEIRSPNDKTPIEKSEVAAGGRDDKDGPRDGKRRRRRRRHLGPPSEVEAALAEEEEGAVDPESLADAEAEERNGARAAARPRAGRGDAGGAARRGARRAADARATTPPDARRLGRLVLLTRVGGTAAWSDGPAAVVRICFVCLGNICRSPTAEAVMRHLVAAGGAGESDRRRQRRHGRLARRRSARSARARGGRGARHPAVGGGAPVHGGRLRPLRSRASRWTVRTATICCAWRRTPAERDKVRLLRSFDAERAARRRRARPVLRRAARLRRRVRHLRARLPRACSTHLRARARGVGGQRQGGRGMDARLEASLGAALGSRVIGARPLSGGDINDAFEVAAGRRARGVREDATSARPTTCSWRRRAASPGSARRRRCVSRRCSPRRAPTS